MDLVVNSLNATTIALASLILFCFFLYGLFKFSRGKEPPTVAGAWPILGHLPLMSGSKSPHRTLGALADKYGPIFTIKLGAKRAVVINNWEIAKECFTTNDTVVFGRPKLVSVELMSYNQAMFALAPYGPYWRKIRKLTISEILSPQQVRQQRHLFESEVQESIKELFDLWRSNKNESGYALVDLKQWFSHLIFNMVLQMITGKRYFSAATVDDEKAQRCVRTVEELMRLMGVFTVGDAVPWLRRFDLGGNEKAMKEIAKELDIILGEELEEHRKRKGLGEAKDFIDVMISLFDGTITDGVDADTVIKSTILVCIFNMNIIILSNFNRLVFYFSF